MEKRWSEDDSSAPQRPNNPSNSRILFKLILAVSVVASFWSISGSGGGISVFGDAFPRDRFFGHRHSAPCNEASAAAAAENEFRLVSVHRAGVGKNRNQVYQVLDIHP